MNKLKIRDLWSQLKKRKVVRVAWIYLIVSLLLILIATVTFESLGVPDGAVLEASFLTLGHSVSSEIVDAVVEAGLNHTHHHSLGGHSLHLVSRLSSE